ncbi:MAG: glutathione S-transferase N-terminal domain-containing protein [bacterium]|nr:glutathione S-transferase N-terminal domain-containing protein [bacterium]MDW8164189.1 glutaredoxin domain-containing protein [Candidatus Omnitrophota bacterium]
MNKKVILYSTKTCPFCRLVKDFLKQNNIEFIDYDVGEDREKLDEMVKKSGQMGVPVIDIDGEIIVGFDKGKIKEVLGI